MVKKKKDEYNKESPDLVISAIEEIGSNVMTSLDELKVGFYISTGMWGFDFALGQGMPNVGVIEIHGPNTIGKTSVALHMTNRAIQKGMTPYYIDMEYAVNDNQAAIFIKDNKVRWIQPESGNKALDIIKYILRTTKNSFIVLDSVGATVPEVIAEGDVADSHIGVQARMFMQFGPTAKVWTRKNGNLLLAINQESTKINPMGGPPGITLAGGRKWEYVPDIRFRLTKKFQNGDIKEGDDQIGHIVEVKVTKNRFGVPFRTAELPLIYGIGFDTNRELIDNAVSLGVVNRAGTWYNYGEQRLGQGLSKSSKFLSEAPEIAEKIFKELNEIIL